MNKDLMLKNLGESDITVKYKLEWTLGDASYTVSAELDFFTDPDHTGYITFPLGDLVQNQPIEGSITVPSTHIYGQVVGGSNCYIRQEECVDIEPDAPNGWRFKITGNNPYLVAEFDSGY